METGIARAPRPPVTFCTLRLAFCSSRLTGAQRGRGVAGAGAPGGGRHHHMLHCRLHLFSPRGASLRHPVVQRRHRHPDFSLWVDQTEGEDTIMYYICRFPPKKHRGGPRKGDVRMRDLRGDSKRAGPGKRGNRGRTARRTQCRFRSGDAHPPRAASGPREPAAATRDANAPRLPWTLFSLFARLV